MKLHIFNPENDLALADGGANYCAPPAAMSIAHDLATLPLWFATENGTVFLPGELHRNYYNEFSSRFSLASPYENVMKPSVSDVEPWGWSMQMRRRLLAMGLDEDMLPTKENIASMREVSNRRTSITILQALHEQGVSTPVLPQYFTQPNDVADFINGRERSVVKAPWSGSGKGIAWGIGRVEPPMEHFYSGIIRRQGGVVCEEFLENEIEFAMEFLANENGVEFAGYSLFTASKGSYSGNILADDARIEDFLAGYVERRELAGLKRALCGIMRGILAGTRYSGYFGIDMTIYKKDGTFILNPCMELNLRMNMGMASRIIFDRHVAPGSTGRFRVDFFRKNGEALEMHKRLVAGFPLHAAGGKIEHGYVNFSPVTEDSKYVAYAVVDGVQQPLEQLYFMNC